MNPKTLLEYTLFFDFLKAYTPSGFHNINRHDPLILELEELMEKKRQFFYVADIINLQILFTSKQSTELIGLEPEKVSVYHFMEATHKDDLQRLGLGRAKLIKIANCIFIAGKGDMLLSTNFKIRNAAGTYSDFLIQNYLYFTDIPYKTVFYLKIHTSIDTFKLNSYGYHYYLGNDFSYFRYPDKELLNTGNVFSHREFEIIKLVSLSFSSEQIAEKLFLSVNTVNTHRRNILKKTNKAHISDLIYELQERGIL